MTEENKAPADDEVVEAHTQLESTAVEEIIPEHEDRKTASQTIFNAAKRTLTKLYGGKRCMVCELRGEDPLDHHPENHIESHHIVEWCHANQVEMWQVEMISRMWSPMVHGLYLLTAEVYREKGPLAVRPFLQEWIKNGGGPVPSIWDIPEVNQHPLTSLDDPRCQWFLCHAHHQQSTNAETAEGFDILGLHHAPGALWILYMAMGKGVLPMRHAAHHDDGLERRVDDAEE